MIKDIQKEFLENRNKNKDVWRIFRVISDFTEAFEELDSIGPAISIFGSARSGEDDPYYQTAVDIAKRFSIEGYTIITGGGPGIMEAANKGAFAADKVSIGLNIELPHEQNINPYVNLPLNFKYFFTRKVTFMKYAVGFVVMPGGFGTMDELFESLVLKQTNKIGNFPIVLYGKSFWQPLLEFMEHLVRHKYIDSGDTKLFIVTDDVDEVVSYIKSETGRI